jgi:hypothetical protein
MFWNALWFKRNEQLKKRRFSLVGIQAWSGDPVGTISASSGFLGKWRSPASAALESDHGGAS